MYKDISLSDFEILIFLEPTSTVLNSDFIISIDKKKLKEDDTFKNLKKEQMPSFFIELLKTRLWSMYFEIYSLTYIQKESICFNKNKFLDTEGVFFLGPTMNSNGIKKYLKRTYNEEFLKLIDYDRKLLKNLSINQIYKNSMITPEILKKKCHRIIFKDYDEFYELSYEDESEYFSKDNFSTEILFYNKGKLGKEIQQFIKCNLKNEC